MAIDTSSPAPTTFFEVLVAYKTEHGAGIQRLGAWQGIAADEQAAMEAAHAKLWDSRLTAAGCLAVFDVAATGRYLFSEGWTHIFVGAAESHTRWVFDRASETLVYGDIAAPRGAWLPMSNADKDDLVQSLRDNDVPSEWEDFGVEASNALPPWADVASTGESARPSRPSGCKV